MNDAVAEFLRYLSLEKNASALTLKSYREDLTQAIEFLTEVAGAKIDVGQITSRHLRAYLVWLSDKKYARTTIARRLAAVRSWFRFLCRRGFVTSNPGDGLRGPRQEKKLPNFLTEADTGKLLAAPTGTTPLCVRRSSLA